MQISSARITQASRENFVSLLLRTFRADLGPLDRIAGEDALRQFFHHCMARSEAAGFALQREIIRFSFIALHMGLFFDTDPLLDEVREGALWSHPGVHPNVGLNRMFANADLMIAEGLLGADQGFTPGFPEACAKAAGNDNGAGDPLERARIICTETNPRRAAALGGPALDRALRAGWRDLEENHPRFRDHPLEWMICSVFLGHGFARNPLYSWVSWDIAQGGLPAVRRRLHE
ncbi:MAG: hypothetical protein Q4G25_16605 [Paracoccus sp. (in: a-proteobacteria)]|nr:hypothetical protein [Paracoccus sp. (in: a-proteobacteria)]